MQLAAPRQTQDMAQIARQARRQIQRAGKHTPSTLRQGGGGILFDQCAPQIRRGHRGHVEIRIQLARHALQGDEGLEHQRQIGRQGQAVVAQHRDHVAEHAAKTQMPEGHAAVGVDEGVDFRQQACLVDIGVAAPFQQHVGHRRHLLRRQAMQQTRDLAAAIHAQPPDHAEVDQGDAVLRQEEHVAGVGIGMEETVLKHHLEDRRRAAARQLHAIESGSVERFHRAARDAGDEVLHVEPLADVIPMHPGHDDVVMTLEIVRDALGAAAFGGEIQLAPQRIGELAHHVARTVAAPVRHLVFDGFGQSTEQAQVRLDGRRDVGTAHLQYHAPAVIELSQIRLPE